MQKLYFILFLAAFILFVISAVRKESIGRFHLQSVGLACFALVFVIQAFNKIT